MPVYKIADLNIKITPQAGYTRRLLHRYRSEDTRYDFEAAVSSEDIAHVAQVSGYSEGACESIAIFRQICREILYHYDGLFLHSAAIRYRGKAYLFAAPSGTGKTTHIRLWQKCLGDKVTVINGDKPLLRLRDGRVVVYGNPWQGKENYGANLCEELDGIILLSRGEENRCRPITPGEALPRLMTATLVPRAPQARMRVLDILEAITEQSRLFALECNQNDEAVYTVLRAIEGA